MDVEAEVVHAFAQHGVAVRSATEIGDRADVLVVDPCDAHIVIQVKHRSLVTDDAAVRLLREWTKEDTALFVVGDRVTEAARRILTETGGGFLDLRGRLALRTNRLWLNVDVEPVTTRATRSRALSGKAGLEIATALLLQPSRPVAIRELARELGRSPSTVSEVAGALRRDGLVDDRNVVEHTELFWQVAERWPQQRVHLKRTPQPGEHDVLQLLRVGIDNMGQEPGWALTDSAAAAVLGAPVALRSDQVLDFFVPDQSIVRRATSLLGAPTSDSEARATVRVAPVSAAVRQRIDLDAPRLEWPVTHPLFVALDLAQDVGRGREILEAWTPDPRWPRVW